jgi:hypothetical protein
MSPNNGDSEFIRGELRQLRQDHTELGAMFQQHKEARTEDNKALITAIHSLTATCADLSGYIRNFNVKLDSGLVMYQKFSLMALGIMGLAFLGKEALGIIRDWVMP